MVTAIKSRQRPVMVYASEDQVDCLAAALNDHERCIFVHKQLSKAAISDTAYMFNLDELMKRECQGFPILLLADPLMMRGLNYRSSVGIDQYLCRPFKTKRDSLQAQGRVGRFTDKCARFRTIVELVDEDLKSEYLNTLHQYVLKLDQ